MKTSEETKNIFKALSDFRAALQQPSKDANNPFFKSTYVTLDGVVKAIDEAIKGTGLSYSQEATSDGNQISVSTHVFHTSGEFISYDPLTLPTTKADAQAFGSAVTYAKRYALGAVFGVTSDVDDDGNSTSGKNAPKNTNSKESKNSQSGLTKAQKDVLMNKMTEFANSQGFALKEAENKLFAFLKIKSPLSNIQPNEFGILMNYFNRREQEANS